MVPYNFIIALLYPLELRHKKMFGVDAYYYGDKILFALREKEQDPEDNGIWIATQKKHHQKLRHTFQTIRPLSSVSIKSWLMLPAEYDNFENEVHILVDLIKAHSPLIGNLPKPKK